jgi:hypothetical protein
MRLVGYRWLTLVFVPLGDRGAAEAFLSRVWKNRHPGCSPDKVRGAGHCNAVSPYTFGKTPDEMYVSYRGQSKDAAFQLRSSILYTQVRIM